MLFVCKTGFAMFVDIEDVTQEDDFGENHKETSCTRKKPPDKQDATKEQIRRGEWLAKSMSYDYKPSGKSRQLLVFFIY